jgi:hypothetical protein
MYKLTDSTNITRIIDTASIPADPANKDYAEYLVWLEEELGQYGIISDVLPHNLPPNAFSGGENVRAYEDSIEKFEGHIDAFADQEIGVFQWLHIGQRLSSKAMTLIGSMLVSIIFTLLKALYRLI